VTKHERLKAAIQASGWAIVQRAPGVYLATDPASDRELPTPDYIPKRWWGQPTYKALRQLCFAVDGDWFVYVAARECPVPWVRARERKLSLAAAIAYVQAGSTRR
jgi:hypothetical protein